ncbi:hydroxyacid dehydrogenase [Phenylobacterium sp.]|uniref:hydroxyacid dehydrogenase n=1 Tax=Phenylobacterium sp. TaxID=1871053 RepID=UPI002ED89451
MKVAVFEATEWEHQACLSLQPRHTVHCTAERLTSELVDGFSDAEIVTTFIWSDLSAAVLRRLPKLRLIATRSTGFDHIDLDHCRKAGVTVCNVPDYGDHTVAEHVFALLLAFSRRIVQAAERTRRGDFSEAGLRGFDLAGKTLGVVGAGRIGRRVAGIARGLGMHVIAFDLRPDPEAAAALGFRYAPLAELLASADVVSLHLPGGAGSHHLLGEPELARMKPGAVLINTSRGGVVDGEALVRALASGHLAGAGLDVVAEEGALREEAEIFRTQATVSTERLRALVADHALLSLPNVIVTPHIAYDSREAVERIIDTTLANIAAFEAGAPQNVVS